MPRAKTTRKLFRTLGSQNAVFSTTFNLQIAKTPNNNRATCAPTASDAGNGTGGARSRATATRWQSQRDSKGARLAALAATRRGVNSCARAAPARRPRRTSPVNVPNTVNVPNLASPKTERHNARNCYAPKRGCNSDGTCLRRRPNCGPARLRASAPPAQLKRVLEAPHLRRPTAMQTDAPALN